VRGERDGVTYPVNEVFLTVQGEAANAGLPAVFVRLQGCSVGCAFCDTKHTWELSDQNFVPLARMLGKTEVATPQYAEVGTDDLVQEVVRAARGARLVVLTGGEPADYDLEPLAFGLEARGLRVQVETSGTTPVMVTKDAWVTVSPKILQAGGLSVVREAVERADEIKHPTATQRHVDELRELLAMGWHRPGIPVWLQPLSQSPQATARCVEWCRQYGWRLSVQTHKYLGLR